MIRKGLFLFVLSLGILYFIYSLLVSGFASKNLNANLDDSKPKYNQKQWDQLINDHFAEIQRIHDDYKQKELQNKKQEIKNKQTGENIGNFALKTITTIQDFFSSDKGKKFIDSVLSYPFGTKNIDPYNSFLNQTITQGQGEPAICGQQVTLQYYLSDGVTPMHNFSNNDLTKSFLLGKNSDLEFEYLALGMKQGEIRRRNIGKSNKNKQSQFLIAKLTELTPKIHFKEDDYQIFDKYFGTRDVVYKCGEQASFSYVIKDFTGKIIYETKENVTISIGGANIPVILNLITEKMGSKKSKKVALFKPKMLKTLFDKDSAFIPIKYAFNSNQFYIIEVKTAD